MALKELRVEVRTLEQINEILAKTPEGQQELQKVVISAVDKLWKNICVPNATLVLIDDKIIELEPKIEFKDSLKGLVGTDGPYLITKRCKSWVGLSEGVYQVKDCPVLVPVSWFKEPKAPEEKISKLLVLLLTLISILQSLILLALII